MVLAVLGVLLSLAHAFARGSPVLRAARSVRSAVLWARTEALWRGAPVAVTELPGAAGLLVSLAADPGSPCAGGARLTNVAFSEHPGVRFTVGLPRGLVWLPSGSGRSCSGGGVISATMELTDGRRVARVVVSALGRVRLEQP